MYVCAYVCICMYVSTYVRMFAYICISFCKYENALSLFHQVGMDVIGKAAFSVDLMAAKNNPETQQLREDVYQVRVFRCILNQSPIYTYVDADICAWPSVYI